MDGVLTKTDNLNRINGIFLGVATVMNFVVGAVADYVVISNLFPLAMALLGVVAALTNLLYGQVMWRVSVKGFVFFFIFTIQVLVGVILGKSGNSVYYAECFLCIGIPSLFLATRKIDYDVLRHTILVVAIVSVPHFISILLKEYTIYTAGEQMGNAYSIIAILFIAAWTLFDSKDRLVWKIISIGAMVLCFSILVKVMTRGAWLCVFVFFGYLLWKKTRSKKMLILMVILCPAVIFGIYYLFKTFLMNTKWFYNLFYMKSEDVLNGRGQLLAQAFSYRGVLETFIGSGVGSYYGMYKTYPHNIFAQLYYDQGLIAVFIVVTIFISGCKGLIRKAVNGQKQSCFLVLVICAGFVKLMVSSYFWIEQLFWIMMGLALAGSRKTTIISEGQQEHG